MKPGQMIALLLIGMVAYMLIKQQSAPVGVATYTSNPSGGRQYDSPQDPYAAVGSAISSIFSAIGAVTQAQTAPKSL
jgi:hypothetical protein